VQPRLENKDRDIKQPDQNMVLEIEIMVSCKGVAIKNVKIIPPAPTYFITLAAPFAGIRFENSTKNNAKPAERNSIPPIAQNRAALSAPFTAFSLKGC
jgi:hypothetical protein